MSEQNVTEAASPHAPCPRDESELLALARAGDDAAFAVLLAGAKPRLLRMLLRMLGNRADADDVLQEASICALRGIGSFRGEARFYSWLYCIARHLALAHLRARQSLPGMDAGMDGTGAGMPHMEQPEQPEALLACRQLRNAIFDSMRQLPPHLRTALMLREYHDLRYGAIARLQGCPVGTVRSRIARARAALSDRLRDCAPG